MTPAEELNILRQRGRGILSEALTRPVEGTHGGDHRARQQAIGEGFTLILTAWDKLAEDYAEFLRRMIEGAKPKAAPATAPAPAPTTNGVKR